MTSTLPRSRSTDRRYYGVVEAIVANVTDDPEHECRVTLRFPFFDGATAETDWCRVAQPYAGNGYGAVFVPEEGDEVLVAFVHGDMRFPIVLGGLYNGVDKPPTDRTASRDQKMIRTKHGHQVVLDDSQGQEAIRITTAGGHELILDDASGTVAITGNGVKITLDDTGSITVQGTNITVEGSTVTVEAEHIALGSTAAALSPVLGEEFMAIFNTHVHTLVPPLSIPTLPPVPPLTPAVFSQIVKITA
jgi:phage baseplate assembly protein V